MTEIIFAIPIFVGLLGGLLYIIYLPFKKRILKSSKLSLKLNKQINWAYILMLYLLTIFLLYYQDYRTPSKDRLEKISNIKLPINYEVIRDEYQDSWQGYCINYEAKFDHQSTLEIIKNINISIFYNQKEIHEKMLADSIFTQIDNGKAIWRRSNIGYHFNRQDQLTNYSIDLDTVANILKYNECAD